MAEKLVVDGGNYGTILKAIDIVLLSNYRATDTELIFDYEAEECTLRLCGTHETLAVIPC